MSDSDSDDSRSLPPAPVVPFPTKISGQIKFLLHSLNDYNSDSIFQELSQFVNYGVEGSILVLKSCLESLKTYEKELKNAGLSPLYASIVKLIMDKPYFTTVICESLRNVDVNEEFLQNFCGALQLSCAEKVGVGLALSNSENNKIRTHGRSFCMGQIAELCTSPFDVEKGVLIQNILLFLKQCEGLNMHVNSFMQMLSLLKLDGEQFILAPLVSDEVREYNFWRHLDLLNEDDDDEFDVILEELEEGISMSDVMTELGYGCTLSVSQCKEILSLFLPLSHFTISKIVGTVSRTHSGLDESQDTLATFRSAITRESVVDIATLNSWDKDVLVDAINQLAPGTDWKKVMESLDHEGFYIPNDMAFSFLMSVYKRACKDPFPLHAICGYVWKNVEGQLSFLKHAVSVPPEVFTFSHSERKLSYDDTFLGYGSQPRQIHDAWQCLDLLEILCQLSELGYASSVRSILEKPRSQCPEVLLIGMARVNTAYGLIPNEVVGVILPQILKNTSENRFILNLWHANSDILLRGFIEAMNLDPEYFSRILDACQELKILSSVLDKIPFYYGIQLVVIGSKKNVMELENWLSSRLMSSGDAFYTECLKFVKQFHPASNQFQPRDAVSIAFSDSCATVLKVLRSHNGSISSSALIEETEKIYTTLMISDTRLKNGGVPDSNSDSFSADIEKESNSYFHQMFNDQLSIDEVIQMLTCFKDSSEKREQLIFNCMIANLFEEYNFFSKYPERQLKLAAVLFGSLIKFQLVTHITLGIALRAVLDALRKPADSKMFTFGTLALEQFLDRLVEWPQYCNHILQISHLRIGHPNLITMTEIALNRRSATHNDFDVSNVNTDGHQVPIQPTSVEFSSSTVSLSGPGTSVSEVPVSSGIQPLQKVPVPSDERRISLSQSFVKPVQASAGQLAHSLSSDVVGIQKVVSVPSVSSAATGLARPSRAPSARFGSALNIETLVAAAERREKPIEAPAPDIQDKISFIINNLSAANFEAKAKDFSDILKEQYYAWFAEYMVMKRASIETNFHDLYLKFLAKVNLKPLIQEIIQATYENCRVLLGSELIKSSVEERSLLKNLGSWLGKITIGRNYVLRARELDPKSLILEAYEKGLMIAVIPFTSKILESCSTSVAYHPPNPWTMAILGLLAEIYAMPNLKMNLKFEIEVLFKNLGVDLKDVAPSSLLKDKVREVEGNPDFSNKDIGIPQPPLVNEVKPGIISSLNQVEIPADAAPALHPSGHSRMMSQFGKSFHHHASGTLVEEEKLVSLGFSDQVPAAHSLLQGQVPYSINQVPMPVTNLEQQIVVNEKIQAYGLHMHFQRALPIAMDRAVKDIVSSIVQRSVSIATQTTRELVLKDYAMEPDETLMRNAAHLMVARLAGSLAHVTCKEPLRSSISNHLRTLLQGITGDLDTAVQIVTYDNLDLGCVLIEQAATEKAVQTIDGEIAQQLNIRRKQRETHGTSLYDPSMYAQGQMSILPEALRPRPGQLSHSQQRVYEDFARFPGQNRTVQSPSTAPVIHNVSSSNENVAQQVLSAASAPVSLSMYPGIGSFSQTTDAVTEEIGPLGVQIHSSALPTQKTIADDLQTLESISALSFPSASPHLQGSGSIPQTNITSLASDYPATYITEPLLTTGDALEKYESISDKLESLLADSSKEGEIQVVVAEVPSVILRCISRDEAALAVAQRAFKGLYENVSDKAHIEAYLSVLAAIRDVSKLIVKELTSWVIYSEDDRKFNKDITVGLIQCDLLSLAEYNLHMAKLIDGGRNKAATDFAISLIEELVICNSKVIAELYNLVDALTKFAARPGSPESLLQLLEIAKNPSSARVSPTVAVGKDDSIRTPKDRKASGIPGTWEDSNAADVVDSDLGSFNEKVSALFGEWYQICEVSGASDAASARFVSVLQQRGLLKGDDTSDRLFRRIMELSVSHCLSSEIINSSSSQSLQGQPLSFLAIDIFAKLVFSVLKFCTVEQGSSKFSLLPKVLNVAVKFIQKDAEDKRASFNPRPYFRLFINWMIDLPSLEPLSEGSNFLVLTALANAFHALQPLKVPGFCFAWLELVSHRRFMSKLLTANAQKGWPYMHKLLIDLFQFMEPFLRNSELGDPVRFFYKGMLRVLLVLLHDFPDFLCDYHFSFCDVIPSRCIQMRNIILVAFPRHIRFPDPSAPNLKIDLLNEITQAPRILSEVDGALKANQIKADLDEFLKGRQLGSSFLTELRQKLLLSPSEAARAGTSYNVPLLNSLVLYVGMHAILQQQQQQQQPQQQPSRPLMVGPAVEIYQSLATDLDAEGRYQFLNAVANQLRYPNSHTYYFSFVMLYLFHHAKQEMVQEQITRVLLERHKVKKPHPWGILVTSVELIKNNTYDLWSKNFVRAMPEVEKMFESIMRSYGGPKPGDDRV